MTGFDIASMPSLMGEIAILDGYFPVGIAGTESAGVYPVGIVDE
jgi:hypothetical protein